jgi:Fe-S-cluster-containing dehydrogenase component/formate-dependent nitrite reductase membrane component NrfD
MRYGFLIDQTSCIGCHACTVACKAEHDVPLGVFRTWVKYIEKGEFPNSRRHFLVERCNHCANAPCVKICPTGALFTRPDGIVDFDKDRCIGCKSCMQACPYDAIYIDPAEHTAAKCNFCAHRIDQGLQPACVLVCPEEAIIFGDLDDSSSRISQLVGRQSVAVRRPEQGTEPKLFYLGADATALMPEALPQPLGAMWTEPPVSPTPRGVAARTASPSTTLSPRTERGSGNEDRWLAHTEHAQVDYNVAHPAPWGWRVGAYLVTKSLAAGLFLVLAGLLTAGVAGAQALALPATLGALVFLGLTALLLVVDLKRPERFLYILLKPQWRSWLTRGTAILIVYGALLVLWGALDLVASSPPPLAFTWLVALFAVGTAGYTALLFAQAEGRDLWQGPLVAAELLAQALVAGAAGLGLVALFVGRTTLPATLASVLLVALLVHATLIALSLFAPHPTANAAWGARELTRGAFAARFWRVGVAVGIALPVALVALALASGAGGLALLLTLAALTALLGLAAYEDAFVRAGQAAPLS